MSIEFCITFTTIPTRLKNIHKTIKSIEKQTLKPKKIFLNIPNEYYRFPNVEIPNEQLEELSSDLVEINRCNDYGPATKIMGSLKKVKNFDCAIIIDDDHIYHEKMCEIFIREFKKNRINYSYYIQKIFDLNMAQCADGFLINTKFLDKIELFYNKFVYKNKNMFYDDDLWFAIYLQLVKKTKIIKLLEIFQKNTGLKIVYTNQNASNPLNKTIHGPHKLVNRRKIQKIEYIKFLIKKIYTSF